MSSFELVTAEESTAQAEELRLLRELAEAAIAMEVPREGWAMSDDGWTALREKEDRVTSALAAYRKWKEGQG